LPYGSDDLASNAHARNRCESVETNTTSGGLNGVVTDHTGAVIPSAEVAVKDINKGTKQTTIGDGLGTYRFSFSLPGRCELAVNRDGFRQQKCIVDVLLGPTVTVNISLVLAATSSEITISGDAPTIQTENGDVSATMNPRTSLRSAESRKRSYCRADLPWRGDEY
jgi:hypothetical protein